MLKYVEVLSYSPNYVVQEGLEPPRPEGNGFTDRRANRLLNCTICGDEGNRTLLTLVANRHRRSLGTCAPILYSTFKRTCCIILWNLRDSNPCLRGASAVLRHLS